MKKIILFASALTLLSLTACTGPFKLTKSLHEWNRSLNGPWVEELCFLGLAFFPVYGATIFCDAILFNSIEFWGGENPIATTVTLDDGTQVAFEYDQNVMTGKDAQGNTLFTAVMNDNNTVMLYDADGAFMGEKQLTAMAN